METNNKQSLNNANKVRAEISLNKIYRFSNHGITSFKKLIDSEVFSHSIKRLVPELRYNRLKFNRMTDHKKQDAYYKKCTENTKTQYSLYYDDRTSTDVSKFVFDYFNETLKNRENES